MGHHRLGQIQFQKHFIEAYSKKLPQIRM